MITPGWYWVRMGQVWEVAFKTQWGRWERAGEDDRHISDEDFDEIDPREIVRSPN